jgi:hypothetical protein
MNLIKSHKIVTATILVGIIGSAVGIAVINQPVDSPSIEVSSMVKEKPSVESAKIPAEQSQEIEETPVVTEVVETAEIAPKRVVAEKPAEPKVLSIQEYANQYLDVSTEGLQECFDAIVAEWPERFAPEVRERNVKGLRVWASVCATGIKSSITRHTKDGPIYLYGENGEFFDSPQAKAYW